MLVMAAGENTTHTDMTETCEKMAVWTGLVVVTEQDIGMTENIGESGLKLEIWFRRRKSTDKAYILHARSSGIKQAWTQDISKLLWRQAFRSKGECKGKGKEGLVKALRMGI